MRILRITAIIVVLTTLQVKLPDLFREYDALMQNLFYSIRGELKTDDRIVIADINDAAILEYGDWPWTRTKIAELLDSISACSPKVIYLNFYFRKRAEDQGNNTLSASMIRAGNVVIPFTFERVNSTNNIAIIEAPSLPVRNSAVYLEDPSIPTDIIKAKILHEPEQAFAQSAAALGFNNNLSIYGYSRYTLQTVGYGNNFYPAVSLAIASVYNEISTKELRIIPNEVIKGGSSLSIPIDNYATSMINFCGAEKKFRHISVSEILGRNFDKNMLSGKIVLVGLSDKRNLDPHRTPFTAKMSSTELWATVTANTLESPPFIRFNILLLSLILPILAIILVTVLTEIALQLPEGKGIPIALLFGAVLLIVNFVVFVSGYWVSLLLPIFYSFLFAAWLIYKRVRFGSSQRIKIDDIEYTAEGEIKKIGRYCIEKEIGSGSMGTVYRATDPKLHRTVAIKTIKLGGGIGIQKELKERFYREARAAAGLKHESIVTVYDFGDTQSIAFMVMEFVEGETLEALIAQKGRISVEETVRIIGKIACGIKMAHTQGIIHRDIKPANIMVVRNNSEVKLMDFGVAKTGGALTDTGKALGTPYYMSPEQLNGEEIDNSTDIFSLAVTAYECISGIRPFAGENLSALTYAILHKSPQPLFDRISDLPKGVDVVLAKALAKNRDNRYRDVTTFADDLEKSIKQ